MSEKLTNSSAPPPPPPPPRPAAAAPPKRSRRGFLTLIAVVGGLLTLAPYVPFGSYLYGSIGVAGSGTKNQTIIVDNTSDNGPAAGKTVNVNDLTTFPPNSHWLMTYPSSGDPTLDGQNTNTFVKFDLIRLPSELGGSNKDPSAFVAFSKVCVHLWCSPNYGGGPQNPTADHRDYECPCHGSLYSVGESNIPVGVAFKGPAAVQPPPTNAIPMLTLTADSTGRLQVVPPVWDVDHNGVIGYGRTTGNGAFAGGYSPQ